MSLDYSSIVIDCRNDEQLEQWMLSPVDAHSSKDYSSAEVVDMNQHWPKATFVLKFPDDHSIFHSVQLGYAFSVVPWPNNAKSDDMNNDDQCNDEQPEDE